MTLKSTAFLAASLLIVAPALAADPLPRIRVSDDRAHFVEEGTGRRFVIWGVNYDHDGAGRLLEDYWNDEWPTVVEDFAEIKALGANLVRVHLQTGKFLKAADQPDEAALKRLGDLVKLAEETGLYLDVTGLGGYHKQDVPAWYDALDETARWDAQANFWKAVAGVCKESPAVFCYDLMNEPVGPPGEKEAVKSWLVGEPLGGKYFVQRITLEARGRDNREIARAWIARLTSAIREVDDRTLVTVGVIPWAQVFKGAKPLFHDPEVGEPLDFVAVHFYPKAGKLDETIEALKVYEVGKPLVIEEIFPLGASLDETVEFIERSRPIVDGWVSFYWGKTIEESEKAGDMHGAIMAAWLKRFRDLAPAMTKADAPKP
jgi:hypothetical protein